MTINSEAIEPRLADAVCTRARDFAAQLRQLDRGDTAIPNLDWTVAGLAQHVACLPRFWLGHHIEGATFERPDDIAAFSIEMRSHLTEEDPDQLAGLIEAEFDHLLAELASTDTRWLYGIEVRPTVLCGFAINELVLHGRDLAAATGTKPPMYDRWEANVAADAIMAMFSVFIDPAKARRQPDGVYQVSFRNGKDYTWTKHGDSLTVTPGKPASAEAKLKTDPSTFLLSSLGRISQTRAAISGGMVSYGRKPWRFIGLGKVMADGI